jgi:hypothetical protein
MAISKKKKIWLIIGGVVLLVLLSIILTINLILANIIEKKIINALKNHPEKNYHITLKRVGVNIINGNVNLWGLKVEPDSAFVEQLKKGQLHQKMVLRLDLPLFRMGGLNLYEAITEGNIDIRKILFKEANVQILVGNKMLKPIPDETKAKGSSGIDSIRINGISGIEIGMIELKDLKLEFFDVIKNEVTSQNKSLDLEIKGIDSRKLAEGTDYFVFDFLKASVEIKNEEWILPGGLYQIGLENMKLTLSDSLLVIKKFSLKPQIEDKFAMAKKLVYTTGIFNVSADEIRLSAIDAMRMIQRGELIIGQVQLNGLDIDIFKDKRKPWKMELRPKYPNQALRTMDFPFYVGTIKVNDSHLKYHEESVKTFGNLMVTLDKMEVLARHITSIKDSSRHPMTAHLRANLFNIAPMTVDFLLPLNSRVDTFFVSGSLGKARMKKFNPALYPALGMKIIDGTLNSVTFKARANRRYIDGEMVMMYDGLETEVIKKEGKDVNKFVSWLANSVVRKSNPGKNDKLRIVPMHFDRDMYKGFVNIAWKAVQTGLVNTISPTGKVIKEESPRKKAAAEKKDAAKKKKSDTAKKKKKKRKKKK